MSWDDYRVLLAFERAGSLGKAARRLGVDKATVSRRISALEDAVGAQLVDRRRGGWRLTAHGRAVAEAAGEMERLAHGAEAQVRGDGPRGTVRLTAPVWFSRRLLLPRVAAFREAHPAVELEVLATNAVLDLGGRDAEVGVRNVVPVQASFVVRRLGVLGSALYAAPSYLDRAGAPAARDELEGRSFVTYHDAITYCPSLRYLDTMGLNVAFRASDTEVLLDAVRAGLGLAIVPCYVGDRDPALQRVLPEVYSGDEILACFPEALRPLPRIRCVVDWLVEVWASEAPALAGRG